MFRSSKENGSTSSIPGSESDFTLPLSLENPDPGDDLPELLEASWFEWDEEDELEEFEDFVHSPEARCLSRLSGVRKNRLLQHIKMEPILRGLSSAEFTTMNRLRIF